VFIIVIASEFTLPSFLFFLFEFLGHEAINLFWVGIAALVSLFLPLEEILLELRFAGKVTVIIFVANNFHELVDKLVLLVFSDFLLQIKLYFFLF